MITDNKRAFKRIKKNIKIRYREEKDMSVEYTSESKNISMGGVYFVGIKKLNICDVLRFNLTDGVKNISVDIKARVVRCELFEKHMVDSFGVAAEFFSLNNEDDKKLKFLISA